MTLQETLHLDRAAGAAALTSSVLAAAHITLWPLQLARLEAYTVGTAIIGAGLSYYAVRTGQTGAAVAYWLCAGMGGLTVAACWRFRRWLAEERDDAANQGALAELLASANGAG